MKATAARSRTAISAKPREHRGAELSDFDLLGRDHDHLAIAPSGDWISGALVPAQGLLNTASGRINQPLMKRFVATRGGTVLFNHPGTVRPTDDYDFRHGVVWYSR